MNRSTMVLLALLAVMGAIVLWVLPGDDERTSSYTKSAFSFSVDSASVIRVSIVRSGKPLTIENVAGRWIITSHGNLPADPAIVTGLIGGFSRFKPGSLVSTNATKQALFQVDSSGSLVTLTTRSGAAQSIVIGKMGPSFSEVYFRMPSAIDVYLGSGITTWSLEREVKDWRDKTIFATPAEAISGLTLSSGGKTRTYSRDSSGWTAGQETVPTETMNPILTTLSNLRAEDFIDSAVQFTGSPSRVDVTGAVSVTLDFYRLGTDTNRYAVQASGSPQKYIVGKHTASALFKAVGEPKPSGVTAARRVDPRAGSGGRAAASATPPRSTAAQPPKADPVKAGTNPAVSREVVKPPEDTRTEPAAVNPFKQKAPGDQRPPAVTTTPPPAGQSTRNANTGAATKADPPPVKTPAKIPATSPPKTAPQTQGGADDDGDLTVHVVKKGETMTTVATKYGVTVEQILKWNLLTSIAVKPGQELYIFVKK